MTKQISLLAFATWFVAVIGFAQSSFCGVNINPNDSLFQKQRRLERQKLDSLRSLNRPEGLLTARTIPVIVHVLHENGSEKVSEEKVKAAINYLNQAFNGNGYYASAPSVDINFCLVYTDWLHTPHTNFNSSVNLGLLDRGGKPLQWSPNQFLNIYVVRQFLENPNTIGKAKIPGYDDGGELQFDGVIIRSNEFGQLVPSNIFGREAPNYIFSHEVGHYCGLFHTFMGDNCTSTGDDVSDTPPCNPFAYWVSRNYPIGNGYDTCPNDALGDLENNFMCYNSDLVEPDRFTAGQIARMNDKIALHRSQLFISNSCEGAESTFFESIEPTQVRDVFPSFSYTFHRGIASGNLSNAQDNDRFQVHISQKGKLTVKLKNLNADFKVALSDSNGEILVSQSSGTGEQTLEYFTYFSKELILRVYSISWNAQNTYSLDVSFERGDAAVTKNVNAYEYWFDNNFEQRVSVNASSTLFQSNISTNNVTNGLHAFHIRFLDDRGNTSPVSTSLFTKKLTNGMAYTVVSYEYWFDDDFQSRINTNITPATSINLVRQINTTGLATGSHSIKFRFKDSKGDWSPTTKDTFSISGVLPVELAYFDAQCFDKKANLNWATESEKDNDYFEVLRSNAPHSGWKVESKIESKGNSTTKTEYRYSVEAEVRTTYFRLRQVDKNGSDYFSKTIAVVCNQNKAYLNIFPNPSNGAINIETGKIDGKIRVEIYDLLGRSMGNETFIVEVEPVQFHLKNIVTHTGFYLFKVYDNKNELIGIKRIRVDF